MRKKKQEKKKKTSFESLDGYVELKSAERLPAQFINAMICIYHDNNDGLFWDCQSIKNESN